MGICLNELGTNNGVDLEKLSEAFGQFKECVAGVGVGLGAPLSYEFLHAGQLSHKSSL